MIQAPTPMNKDRVLKRHEKNQTPACGRGHSLKTSNDLDTVTI